jgi:hypothetical protein
MLPPSESHLCFLFLVLCDQPSYIRSYLVNMNQYWIIPSTLFFVLSSLGFSTPSIAQVAKDTDSKPCRRQGSRLICEETKSKEPVENSSSPNAVEPKKFGSSSPAILKPGERQYYAWPLAIIDPLILGLAGASVASGGHGAIFTGGAALLGWAAAGPIIHWMAGRTGAGFGSAGIRLFSGVFALSSFGASKTTRAVMVGALLLAPTIIDVAFLGVKEGKPKSDDDALVMPMIELNEHRRTVGLAFRF